MELENYLKGKTIESVKETENGLEIVFKEEKFEPKHGEFYKCVFKDGTFKVGIFDSIGRGCNPSFASFCSYISGNKLYPMSIDGLDVNHGYINPVKEFVEPTQEEKDLLFVLIAKDGKRWNAEKKQIEKIRWRAEKGESYKFVSSYGEMLFNKEQGLPWDNANYNIGNYFKIDEDVTAYIEKMKSIFAENI